MNWNLEDLPAMFFENLEQMAKRRAENSISNIAIARDIPGTIASLQQKDTATNSRDSAAEDSNDHLQARIATALLLLGNGYTDEAHDLVLGLSWRGELPYAHGPPVTVHDEQLQALACYTHCLVHRREGPHASEFDMTGFQNSNYWAGHAMRILVGSTDMLPLQAIQDAVVEEAYCRQSGDAADAAQQWIQDNKVDQQPCYWDPRVLTELCAEVHAACQKQPPHHHALKEFTEQCALMELRILLEHLLFVIMGFDR